MAVRNFFSCEDSHIGLWNVALTNHKRQILLVCPILFDFSACLLKEFGDLGGHSSRNIRRIKGLLEVGTKIFQVVWVRKRQYRFPDCFDCFSCRFQVDFWVILTRFFVLVAKFV